MTTLLILAHHLEADHVGIDALLFPVGSVGGWLGSVSNQQRLS